MHPCGYLGKLGPKEEALRSPSSRQRRRKLAAESWHVRSQISRLGLADPVERTASRECGLGKITLAKTKAAVVCVKEAVVA